jgi:cytochrome P450
LDKCITETVRLTANGAFARRNMGPDVVIDGRPIRTGDFALVMTGDVNLDPRLYVDPLRFDPDRDLSMASRSPHGFLGFGAG